LDTIDLLWVLELLAVDLVIFGCRVAIERKSELMVNKTAGNSFQKMAPADNQFSIPQFDKAECRDRFSLRSSSKSIPIFCCMAKIAQRAKNVQVRFKDTLEIAFSY
jgi:hypothetical protein